MFVCNVTAFVIPRITAYDPFIGQSKDWRHLQDITLADPRFGASDKVHVLLGAQIHAQIIEQSLRKGDSTNAPIAMKTLLGWIVSVPTSDSPHDQHTVLTTNLQVDDVELNGLLRKFWEIEETPTTERHLTEEERFCEEFYKSTVKRNDEGRYLVRLPFKSNVPNVWEGSYSLALRMLTTLERKFCKDSHLHTAYLQSMQEYIDLGHMRRVSLDSHSIDQCFFLPHHGVIKESSATTRLRTVFNASAKTKIGKSLNDFLLVGPNLLSETIDLLSSWRRYPFVFSADVEKMFRQILVQSEDQHFQAIVWRGDETGSVESFFLTTVTFGLASSPYLASRTLKQLAEDERAAFPLGSYILEREVYADDVLSGDFTLNGARNKQEQVINLLSNGGFKLRKWLANRDKLLEGLPPEDHAAETNLKVGLGFSVLGIAWDPKSDCFYFNLELERLTEPITRRSVLSKTAKLFDPLGWISPTIIVLKIFLQSLWALTKEWDQVLPVEHSDYWRECYSSLAALSEIRIPRYVGLTSTQQSCELHGFADASKLAYAGVVYLRVLGEKPTVYLLGSKTKVAPVKTLSIPRLELCAAQLMTKLTRHYVDHLGLQTLKIHLWSDSKDVLYWIKDVPAKWPTFIANRCADIATMLNDASWHHINSADNPADMASRGISARELVNNDLWWHGPRRLTENNNEWLCSSEFCSLSECSVALLTELRVDDPSLTIAAVTNTKTPEIWDLVRHYSSLSKLIRITVYILRFVRRISHKTSIASRISPVIVDFPIHDSPLIIGSEIRQAKILWSCLTQLVHFSKEFELLKTKQLLPRGHYLKNLNPVYEGGVIRVGGRLKHSSLSLDEKFPIILPASCTFTDLVIRYAHHLTLHGGNHLSLALIRRLFWVIKGKSKVKVFIRNCVTCKRFRAPPQLQLMGDLPAKRVQSARPFAHSGVDYAGPYLLRTSRHRGYKSYKGYFAVFICLCTKAVHLEVVAGYDTAAFLAAFRRFISRRGPCYSLTSDQGTNFVGADAELRLLQSAGSDFRYALKQDLEKIGTSWAFNPPGAPHFGGLWEAAIRSVKYHLKRIVGDSILTYEEFATLLCQVEACLNSRPLVPLSEDASDVLVLTPAHFLIGEPSFLIAEPRNTDEVVPPLLRWRRTQQFVQRFWDCWSSDYLQQLQKRVKWKETLPSLKVDDVVLIRREATDPTRWPLARVIHVFPGSDGLTRVVAVRTATTTLRRPINKIVKLFNAENMSESEPPVTHQDI